MHYLVDLAGSARRLRVLAALALSVLMTATLVAVRVHHTGAPTFGFLLWNTALALCPLAATTLAVRAERCGARGAVVFACLAVWLLFFPNAPYMVTDLIHLHRRPDAPVWFDLALLASCAWNGLVLGFVSLRDAHGIVARRAGWIGGWVFAAAALGLAAFGIYLGRYPRWNSWDVLTRPGRLFLDVAARVRHPQEHPQTWLVTALFAGFLGVAYLVFHALVEGGGEGGGERG
jgi:uncharacterized membrane protein